MRTTVRLFLCLGVGLLCGCNINPGPCPCPDDGDGDGDPTLGPVVNLRVAADAEAEVLESLLAELRAREVTATVLADADLVAESCALVRELSDEGFELAVSAQVALSTLSYEQQAEHLSQLKDDLEECLGAVVEIFHCMDYCQNEDTCDVVDELGFSYNLGFVAHTEQSLPGHQNDVLPYKDGAYDFWAVPMPSVSYAGQWVPMCDAAFAELVSGAEWGDLLTGALEDAAERTRPLMVDVRASWTGTEEGFFQAFVDFLDQAVEREARFMTVQELVEWSQLPAVQADCGCQ